MNRLLSFFTCIGLVAVTAYAHAADNPPPVPSLFVEVDHPILLRTGKPDAPASTAFKVTPINFPPGDALDYSWRQVQDVLSPMAAQISDGKTITFSKTIAPTGTASFDESGVFEMQVTVTDRQSNVSATRNTWVNVWDDRSPIVVDGKPDPLCVAPGLNPPPSVRNLSPDPGPFQHPRIFCTPSDWTEINQRCKSGVLAAAGWNKLQNGLIDHDHGIDTDGSDFHKLTLALAAYAYANFQGDAPDLTCGIKPDQQDGKPNWDKAHNNLIDYHKQLQDACFAAWLKDDPTAFHESLPQEDQDRALLLAKVVAALCHLHLANCWDIQTGEFHKDYPLYIKSLDDIGNGLQEFQHLALAYDFIAPWMTPDQLRDTRNFLFAVSAGRATGARLFVPQVDGKSINRSVERGTAQNGDFMNIEEEKIVTALAIAGEESAIDPKVVSTFTTVPKPADYDKSGNAYPFDWVQFTNADNGRDYPGAKPYPEGGNWPNARKVEVDNLQRNIFYNDDWYVTPWGFLLNKEAYYGFSAYGLWPAAVAYARAGAFNMYVGSNFYQTALHHIYSYYPGAISQQGGPYTSKLYMFDNHDGGLDYRQVHALFMKYMYPDDPLVDYVFMPYAVQIAKNPLEPMLTAIFGTDPGVNGAPTTLPDMATAKALPLTKLDPQLGIVTVRSGWNEDDMMLYFDAGWPNTGHMHAEKNSFNLFALGRAWAISPGYHQKLNNFYATIMVQDPACAGDAVTQGYVGESESYEPEGSTYPRCHPTPPGHLLEVRESDDKIYTLMAGDAKAAYDFCYCGSTDPTGHPEVTPPWVRADFMYPGLLDNLLKRLPDQMNKDFFTAHKNNIEWDDKINTNYNPVQYAFRTILFVRGKHPYALVVDDFRKEDNPRNYRWMMNCAYTFGPPDGRFANEKAEPVPYSMIMAPGATPTEATLLHLADNGSDPGLPRLLVRDVSEVDNSAQPPMRMDTTIFTNFDNTATDRIFIDRNNVVEPKYKVLLYPYRTGDTLPTTAWNDSKTQLTVTLDDGTRDVFSFTTNDDHRERVEFARSVR